MLLPSLRYNRRFAPTLASFQLSFTPNQSCSSVSIIVATPRGSSMWGQALASLRCSLQAPPLMSRSRAARCRNQWQASQIALYTSVAYPPKYPSSPFTQTKVSKSLTPPAYQHEEQTLSLTLALLSLRRLAPRSTPLPFLPSIPLHLGAPRLPADRRRDPSNHPRSLR